MRLAACPKAELHCHLLGTISPSLIARLQDRGEPVLVDAAQLSSVYPVRGLAGFQRYLDVLKPYQSAGPALLRPILEAHVDALIRDDVRYAELMLSPAMFSFDQGALVEGLDQWREWALGMERGRTQLEFMMVIPRSLDDSALERDTVNYIALRRRNLIAGVALVGPETGDSIRRFERSFRTWRDEGLGIEVHAGEHSGPESVWDALEYARPHRLGHALSAFRDEKLIDRIQSDSIHVEFCPTSNVCTEAVSDIEAHPLRTALHTGISFSLNTDDPGAFECSMSSEFALAGEVFGLARGNWERIYRQTLEARFAAGLRVTPPPGEPEPLLS